MRSRRDRVRSKMTGPFKEVLAASDDGEDRSPRERETLWLKRWIDRSRCERAPARSASGRCSSTRNLRAAHCAPARWTKIACSRSRSRRKIPRLTPRSGLRATRVDQHRAAPSANRVDHRERLCGPCLVHVDDSLFDRPFVQERGTLGPREQSRVERRRPPASAQHDRDVRHRRLGDLSTGVDQERVVRVGMSRARVLVAAAHRRLVEHEDVGRIHGNVVEREADRARGPRGPGPPTTPRSRRLGSSRRRILTGPVGVGTGPVQRRAHRTLIEREPEVDGGAPQALDVALEPEDRLAGVAAHRSRAARTAAAWR